MLPRVGAAEGASLDDPRKLVRIARHGTPKDPWQELTTAKKRTARDALRSRVIGQDAAVEDMVGAIYDAASGLSLDTSLRGAGAPRGAYFFAGPTGVGKTELGKAVAEFIFGDESSMEVFDMGNYRQEQSGERLTGSAPGYVGYSEGGQLTNRVSAKPHSILLFDEIEKAHERILDTFLSVLQDGRLVDGRGNTTWFDQTMIVFTSNIGQAEWRKRVLASPNDVPSTDEVREIFRKAVVTHFRDIGRPELLGRLGDGIIAFDMLRAEHVRAIVDKQLQSFSAAVRSQRRIELHFDGSVADRIERAMRMPDNLLLGARCIQKTLVPIHLRKPLVAWLAENEISTEQTIDVSAVDTGLRLRSGGRELGTAVDRRLRGLS
jgi:ATP-dependent Clp protease ATP-binding subunit ClpA